MESVGIVRKTDQLGRIVLPKELRKMLKIHPGDPIQFFINGDQVIIQEYKSHDSCHVTGTISDQNITLANGKLVLSREAAKEILNELETHEQKEQNERVNKIVHHK